MIPHYDDLADILGDLRVDADRGLSPEEALSRISEYGENRLQERARKTIIQRFFAQFKDVMILILIAAALISFVVAFYEREGFFEPVLILLIVVANAVMGVLQESRAENALEALKTLSAPHARVIRDGKESIIEAAQLVPGDIILLEAGDFVPADARIIHATSLKVEESALTGESAPSEKDAGAAVEKDAALGDRHNMLYSGTGVSYGTPRP